MISFVYSARSHAITFPLPRLYSFRRCPYAMRARLGILFAGLTVKLREIVLKLSQLGYRQKGEVFLQALESLLARNRYLLGSNISIADIGIMPFVRQFAHVDREVFYSLSYPNLQKWLRDWLDHPVFLQAMIKYPAWQEGDDEVVFPQISAFARS